jgi:hypothetical protein
MPRKLNICIFSLEIVNVHESGFGCTQLMHNQNNQLSRMLSCVLAKQATELVNSHAYPPEAGEVKSSSGNYRIKY